MKAIDLKKTAKLNALTLVLGAAVALVAGALSAPGVSAQTRSTYGARSTVTFYYARNSQATRKHQAELRKGNGARMYYDDLRRRWAVEVSVGAEASRPDPNLSADGGNLPNGAKIIYFPTRQSAEGIYQASLRQGDWAKMWYDAKRGEWAVAVKEVPNGRGRRGATSGTTTRRSSSADDNWSADGGRLPNGASVIYFPTKESAEGIYRSSLRQGDWARMWYDAKKKSWAVAVKPR